MPPVYVLMGVAGCGKTTVGLALAGELGCRFYDGDDYQPAENVAKMAGGIPLSDEDRIPWLRRLRSLIQEHLTRGETAVLACSALKRQYRDLLRSDLGGVTFVHLHGDFDLFAGRLRARPAHYMKADMLQSQFDALEAPGPEEAVTLSAAEPVEAIIERILRLPGGAPSPPSDPPTKG